jgi:hypothetical protein
MLKKKDEYHLFWIWRSFKPAHDHNLVRNRQCVPHYWYSKYIPILKSCPCLKSYLGLREVVRKTFQSCKRISDPFCGTAHFSIFAFWSCNKCTLKRKNLEWFNSFDSIWTLTTLHLMVWHLALGTGHASSFIIPFVIMSSYMFMFHVAYFWIFFRNPQRNEKPTTLPLL